MAMYNIILETLQRGMRNAFIRLGCCHKDDTFEITQFREPEPSRLVYSKKHKMLAIEYNRSEFSETFSEELFESKKSHIVFKYFCTPAPIVVDTGDKVYFYFWGILSQAKFALPATLPAPIKDSAREAALLP